MDLLKQLCSIHAPSGEEYRVRDFLIQYVEENKHNWKVKPQLIYGDDFQDCLLMVFGTPRTAVFAHQDTVGFTIGYKNNLIKIGSPACDNEIELSGQDTNGQITCKLINNHDKLKYQTVREIEKGSSLVFKPQFHDNEYYIQSPSLDNRLGVYLTLQLAPVVENALFAFTAWEEHGGGSAEFISRYIYEKLQIRQALIADVTWTTEGIGHLGGAVISIRDGNIPRQKYIQKIIKIANENKLKNQLEIESHGGSDGSSIHASPYPIDWAFVGIPGNKLHSPAEIVYKEDIKDTIKLYETLLKKL